MAYEALKYQADLNQQVRDSKTELKGAYHQALTNLGLDQNSVKSDGKVEAVVDEMYKVIDQQNGFNGNELQLEDARKLKLGTNKVQVMSMIKGFRDQGPGLDEDKLSAVVSNTLHRYQTERAEVIYAQFGKRTGGEEAARQALSAVGVKYSGKNQLPEEIQADVKQATQTLATLQENPNLDLEGRLAA
jgi:hypothetical protein